MAAVMSDYERLKIVRRSTEEYQTRTPVHAALATTQTRGSKYQGHIVKRY